MSYIKVATRIYIKILGRLGSEGLPGARILADLLATSVAVKKSFVPLTPGHHDPYLHEHVEVS